MVGKLWYLKKFDVFSKLDHEEIEEFSEKIRMDAVSADQTIYFPGESAETIYILKKGQVKISRATREGKRITLVLLEPGEIFGELALTPGKERSTVAETTKDSLICSATDEQFREFLADHPELNFEISRVMGDRRRKIESKIENLIFKDASGRLAFVLKDLFDNHPDSSADEVDRLNRQPEISFSHHEIADLCGLTRPTTTKLLNEFQEEGILGLKRRKIKLEDPRRLKRKVNAG